MTRKILYVVRDDGGCGFYRCKQPASFIKRMGLADTEAVMLNPSRQQLAEADLVIFQEMGSVNASSMTRFCLENKIPYMTEFDDYVHHVSPNNVAGYGAWNPSTLFLHRAMENTRTAIGVTVSTNQLARELFPYNQNIFVVPNYLDKDKWSNPMTRHNDGKIRIGWMGGNAHADDLHMISKVIEKITKKYKGKVVFETMGMTRKELAGVFPMESTNGEACPSCSYSGELHHFPGESLDDYSMVVASKGWDIALAPVINNGFGNCKSDIKIKEYAAIGCPIIASPVIPYVEAAKNNAQIIFADTFEEWYDAIEDLIKHPAKRDEMVRKNKEWVSQYWIGDNAQHIFDIYEQVIQSAESIFGTKEARLKTLGIKK